MLTSCQQNCVSFVLTYIYLTHLGSNYFNEVIYDLWEAAYKQYQIWQLDDVENKTVQTFHSISPNLDSYNYS